MAVTITSIHDAGDDVLLVRGTSDRILDQDGKPAILEARGWISATTNHFDPEHYHKAGRDKDGNALAGHRKATAKPREMTREEKRAYAQQILEAREADLAPAELAELDW